MNKERHIYIGIIITLTMTLVMTLVLFTQFNDPTWHDVATTFIFPFIYTIIGAIVVALVGTTIADRVLENYNERLSQGLSSRKIQLIGDHSLTAKLQEDIKKSALIKSAVDANKNSVSSDSDLVVLSLDLDWYSGPRPENGPVADKLVAGERELHRIVNELTESQALIVLTLGTLDRTAEITKTCFKRRFSTVVNAQGRILSDIHSLLTTLPPRNDG